MISMMMVVMANTLLSMIHEIGVREISYGVIGYESANNESNRNENVMSALSYHSSLGIL